MARWLTAIGGAAVAACALSGATLAQQVAPSARPLVLDLPPPADTGTPRFFAPRDLPPSANCVAVLDCRVKVIGEVQHNGAVELNGALLKW